MTSLHAGDSVSIVIPAFNEATTIRACLASLEQQSCEDFEVIVVDNGSTDETASVARARGARVIAEPRRGIAYARQTGFEAARGDIILSTDADSVVPGNWIEHYRRVFADRPETVVAFGPFRYDALTAPTEFKKLMIPLLAMGLVVAQWTTWKLGRPHLPGSNFAVRRTAFDVVHGFRSPTTGAIYTDWEDVQLGQKLKQVGGVQYVPGLVVLTSARKLSSLWSLACQRARNARDLHVRGREL